jgi:NAD-dependent SIR2 family protein deacetylase
VTAALPANIEIGAALDVLVGRLVDGDVLVLSGAGISTESGIPDYRGPTGRARPATPMTYQEFVASAEARQRYWARSYRGWRTIVSARPNAGHHAVAALQQAQLVSTVITQNVDGLHQAAGAEDVIELHGGLDRVICLSCRAISPRAELDVRLRAANPHLSDRFSSDRSSSDRSSTDGSVVTAPAEDVKPDGDVDLHPDLIGEFRVVDCLDCGAGPLKPDVVFFGENVPPDRVATCYDLVEQSRLMLVAGSSLTVASGFRFVRRAAKLGVPIAIVNQGRTRGDALAELHVNAPLGEVLPALASSAIGMRGSGADSGLGRR